VLFRSDPVDASHPGKDPSDDLYAVFSRRLQDLLNRSDSLRTRQVEDALGIVKSQAAEWLGRAQEEGWLIQTSKNPKRFALRSHSLV